MNEKIIKQGVVQKVVEKLKDEKIVVGGNKYFYKSKYHLPYTQEIVDNVIIAFLQSLEDIVEEGDSLLLAGYFSIEPNYWKSRKGNCLYSDEKIEIPAQYRVKMKPGAKLKRACDKFNETVNGEEQQ